MDRITQEAHHRQRMLNYANAHGTTNTSIRWGISRKTICKWKKRYDGMKSPNQILSLYHGVMW